MTPLHYPGDTDLYRVIPDLADKKIDSCFLAKAPRFVHRTDTRVFLS
jgi:hypothetical protein